MVEETIDGLHGKVQQRFIEQRVEKSIFSCLCFFEDDFLRDS